MGEVAVTLRRTARYLPLVLVLPFVNRLVDPAHLFGGGAYEREVAATLLARRYVSGYSNCDERAVQREYVRGLRAAPDVLVLGSSRSMQVRTQTLPGRSLYNAAVASGTLEDALAIYGMWSERGLDPALVVLGLEAWMLNARHGMTTWRTLDPERRRTCRRLAIPCLPAAEAEPQGDVLWELVSPRYLQASVALVAARLRAGADPLGRFQATDAPPERLAAKRPDGSHLYEGSLRKQTPPEVRAIAGAVPPSMPGLDGMTGPDPARARELEAFLSAVARRGRLVLFLPPYHPAAWPTLAGRFPAIRAVEREARSLASARGWRVLGSYDPAVAGCREEEFYDGQHPRESCVDHIFRGLAEQ